MTTDEDELIHRCQSATGSEFDAAFGDLYLLFRDRVYSVAYRITGNPADALDASQETFSILFRKIKDFRFQSKFSSWVYRIAVNASIDLCRRSSLKNTASLDALTDDTVRSSERGGFAPADTGAVRPRSAAEDNELSTDIHGAIQRLSPKLRSIVILRYIENLSYEEVAAVLGCSLGTVKSRLSRAHAALEPLLARISEKHYLKNNP